MKELPELYVYYPSINIKAYDSRGFGYLKYIGVCIIPNVYVFLKHLIIEEDYYARIYKLSKLDKSQQAKQQATIVCKHRVFV